MSSYSSPSHLFSPPRLSPSFSLSTWLVFVGLKNSLSLSLFLSLSLAGSCRRWAVESDDNSPAGVDSPCLIFTLSPAAAAVLALSIFCRVELKIKVIKNRKNQAKKLKNKRPESLKTKEDRIANKSKAFRMYNKERKNWEKRRATVVAVTSGSRCVRLTAVAAPLPSGGPPPFVLGVRVVQWAVSWRRDFHRCGCTLVALQLPLLRWTRFPSWLVFHLVVFVRVAGVKKSTFRKLLVSTGAVFKSNF